ncbi:transglutaminaseTgpA domain-containing protein [Halorussus caseinilyticus]|uniref:transglutaminaseTgpA domain-containing protein n=1 Tax=Halorussus caseinilyticus TaxID=3034025 RepID=UPI0023E8C07E|nr:transglutaminase domain-containing protein [Halorussus sp. DT72]
MSEKPSPLVPDDEQSRDRLRAALVLCCVVAVLLAGTVVPAVSGAGLGGTPLGSVVPTPNVDPYGPADGGGGSAGGGGSGLATGGLGALNPGQQASLGGSLASNESAFRSRNAETHFTVRSSAASYWRTGAYDTYTGSGWEQSGDRRPYTGPIEGEGIQGRKVAYRVTLQRSATALPSVWRANALSRTGADSLSVTDQRAFVTDDPLPAGTTYAGVSHLPPRDPAVLKTAGRDYPAEIERRYTALPEETRQRLGPFTDRLTSDADSPYESARRIESWLESNKTYSLNVSQPADEDVASQFVFEMESGYCEYFATSMVAMLRSQGVPARYVVGYSTGQSVGANTYRVRAMNAHAWVEVYFPDVGWVRFDPTPGEQRLQAEQQALANRTDADAGEYTPNESGSPGEQFSVSDPEETTTRETGTATTRTATSDSAPGGSNARTATTAGTATGNGTRTATGSGTATDTRETTRGPGGTTVTATTVAATTTTTSDGTTATDPGESRGPRTPYEVTLNRTPVPGAIVEVTVRDNATPAVGVPVSFNGERVGVTDDSGTVVAPVPYTAQLRVGLGTDSGDTAALVAPPAPTAAPGAPATFDAPMALTAGPPGGFSSGASLSGASSSGASSPRTSSSRALQSENGSDDDGTEYALATNATLIVSGEVATESVVVVTATVRDVPVRDADVTLDGESVGTTDRSGRVRVELPESPGNVTLAVSRGSVSGERTLTIPDLEVTADPALPVALPGTPVEIRTTYGGDPLANANVSVAGAVRTTDIDGTATATLPLRDSARILVSARGQTRVRTVSGLFVNLAGLLGGIALALGVVVVAASRRGVGPRKLLALLGGAIRAIPGLVVAALFGAADRLSWAVETVADALRELAAGETTVGELLARLRAWLREREQAVRRRSRGALAGGALADGSASDAPDPDDYRTLREAWESFLRSVSVRRPSASTPGELADHAVREDDLPPGPVVTLRDAFRDVEYGARSPGDRLPQVEEAIDAIERATRRRTAEGDGGTDGDADPESGGDE